ncbi:MAG TPA: hypothetical protein VK348_10875, partial [Planctomycetota bacterium]|nr:hypothetical protein [Planctomycetota bacterium]
DRRNMIREIFGTRPLERLPQHRRSFNAYRLYRARLSHGRVLLLPLYLLLRGCGTVMRALRLLRQLAREVLSPHLAAQQRDSGVAPFAAALRKIHRMKAPGLLEAMRLRVRFDPAYSGAPLGWSGDSRHDLATELERDLDFLHVRERERAELRQLAAAARAQVQELHAAVSWLPALPPEGATPQALAAGELAITAAWIGDRMQVRTLLQAERWRLEVLPLLATASVPGNLFGDGLRALLALLHRTPVDHWLRRHGGTVKHRLRANLRRAYAADLYSVRAVLRAFQQLPPGESPLQVAIARLRTLWHEGDEVCRDVRALRAVQALSVLDVRNYRDLVFRLGDYAADGESPEQAMAMP